MLCNGQKMATMSDDDTFDGSPVSETQPDFDAPPSPVLGRARTEVVEDIPSPEMDVPSTPVPTKRARSVRSSRGGPVADVEEDAYSDVELSPEPVSLSDPEATPPPRRPLPALPTKKAAAPQRPLPAEPTAETSPEDAEPTAEPSPVVVAAERDYNEACGYNRVQQFLCSDNVPDSLKTTARTMLEKMADVLDVRDAREMLDPNLCAEVGQTIEKCHYLQEMRACMVRLADVRYEPSWSADLEPELKAAEERANELYQDMVQKARDPSVAAMDYAAHLEECNQAVADLSERAVGQVTGSTLRSNSWWQSLLEAIGLRR